MLPVSAATNLSATPATRRATWLVIAQAQDSPPSMFGFATTATNQVILLPSVPTTKLATTAAKLAILLEIARTILYATYVMFQAM